GVSFVVDPDRLRRARVSRLADGVLEAGRGFGHLHPRDTVDFEHIGTKHLAQLTGDTGILIDAHPHVSTRRSGGTVICEAVTSGANTRPMLEGRARRIAAATLAPGS